MIQSSISFLARFWITKEAIEQVEVFVYELHPITHDQRSNEEWICNYFSECQTRESILKLFNLDETLNHQIIFKGKIIGYWNLDEYNEKLHIDDFKHCEIPDNYFEIKE